MKPRRKDRLKILAAHMKAETVFLEQCLDQGVFQWEDIPESESNLEPALLARLRRLQRICRGLEVDVFAGSIIVDLLQRMDEMQRDLERLRALAEAHTPH